MDLRFFIFALFTVSCFSQQLSIGSKSNGISVSTSELKTLAQSFTATTKTINRVKAWISSNSSLTFHLKDAKSEYNSYFKCPLGETKLGVISVDGNKEGVVEFIFNDHIPGFFLKVNYHC